MRRSWLLAGLLVVGAALAIWWLARSLDARLFALDPATGRVRWSASLPSGARNLGSPVAGNGVVVIQTARHVAGVGGGAVWQVSAYDSRSGRLRWEHTPPDQRPGRETASLSFLMPMVTGEHVIVGDYRGTGSDVLALRIDTGQPVWTLQGVATGETSRGPIVAAASGRVFAPMHEGTDLWLVALAEDDGSELWRVSLGQATLPDFDTGPFIAATAETVYVSTTRALVAIDAASGAPHFRVDDSMTSRAGAIALADGSLYRRTDLTSIAAYDPLSGQPRWTYRHPFGERAGPLRAFVAGGGLVAAICACDQERRRDTGWLLGIEAADGAERWRTPLDDFAGLYLETPLVVGDTVVTGGDDVRDVVVRSAVDGSIRWRLPRRRGSFVATDGARVYAADLDLRWRHWLALLGLTDELAARD